MDFATNSLAFLGIKKDEVVKSVEEPARKPARRVLPEHEGRYKITLPSGSTERSKQILAKQALCKQVIFIAFKSNKPFINRKIFKSVC